jgi:hypothetical protein
MDKLFPSKKTRHVQASIFVLGYLVFGVFIQNINVISLKSAQHRIQLRVLGLSEESNDAYLLKKIKVARRRKITFIIIGILGMNLCFSAAALTLQVNASYVEEYYGATIRTLIGILFLTEVAGWIVSATVFIMAFNDKNPYRPKDKIMSPSKELKLIPVCPNCKKRLPEGNAPFCIYCGKPVKS